MGMLELTPIKYKAAYFPPCQLNLAVRLRESDAVPPMIYIETRHTYL